MGFAVYDIANAKQNLSELYCDVLYSFMVFCAQFNVFNHQDKIFGV